MSRSQKSEVRSIVKVSIISRFKRSFLTNILAVLGEVVSERRFFAYTAHPLFTATVFFY